MLSFFRHALLAATLVSTTACTTLVPIDLAAEGIPRNSPAKVGEIVKIWTARGPVPEFLVTRNDGQYLYGNVPGAETPMQVKVAYGEIVRLEKRQLTPLGTVGAVLLVVGAAVGYVALLYKQNSDTIERARQH